MSTLCSGHYRQECLNFQMSKASAAPSRSAQRGKRVHGVRAIDRGMLRNSSPTGLGRALSGRRFASARRHGKLLVCPTDGPALLLHFGMTGTFVWSGNDHRHDRLVLELDDGDLHYRNMRRLGGIWLAKTGVSA
jgi:formamidopyrimidine-DNA glycosylase